MTSPHLPLDADELARSTEQLRALARGLVRDAAAAEDVAQDALLAAMQHAPPADVPLRWWLRGVARHVAFRLLRTETRRRRREAVAARPEAVAGTAEWAARRAETHRRLLDAALALPEPYRAVVLLRFFEELTPADIAARTGVKPGTVRMRLSRGLGMLRERLDHEEEDGCKAWAFAPLPGLAARAARRKAAIAAGGLAVKTSTKALAAAALLLLASAATVPFLLDSSSQPPVADPPRAETAVAPRSRERHVQEAASPRAESPPPAPDPSTATLAVVVSAWDGTPVAGARVEAILPPPADPMNHADAAPEVVAAATADADGRAVLRGLAPSSPVRLVGSADGFARRVQPESAPSAGETREARLRLLPACSVTGRVKSTRGERNPGVLLVAGDARSTSDAEGRFAFTGLEWGCVEVKAARPGRRLSAVAALRLPFEQELVVVLPDEAVLSGTVRDAVSGEPIAGAKIRAGIHFGMQGEGSATTDAEGRYVIASLPEGIVNKIEIETPGHAGADEPPGTNPRDVPVRCGETTTADFILAPRRDGARAATKPVAAPRPTGAVVVGVADSDGAPIAGARVGPATTGADGICRIEGVPAGRPMQLPVDAEGFGRGDLSVLVEEGATARATVTLLAGPSVGGVVRAPDGGPPPAGTLVQVLVITKRSAPGGQGGPEVIAAEAASVGRGGEYRIAIPWTREGTYRVTAWAPGCLPGSSRDAELVPGTAAYTADVSIAGGVAVRGIVVDDATGEGIAGVSILASAWRRSGGVATLESPTICTVATTDAAGRFHATGFVAMHLAADGTGGRVDVGTSFPGFESKWTGVPWPVADGTTIRLRRVRTYAGVVVWEDGSPAGGVRIDDGSPTSWTVSAPDGTFALRAIEDGPRTLNVSPQRNGDDVCRRAFEGAVPGGGLRIVVVRGHHVSGRVVVEGNRGVPNCVVMARLVGSVAPPVQVTTGSDGSFRLSGLADGSYDLVVRTPERSPYPPDVARYSGAQKEGVAAGTDGLVLELVK